MTHKNNVSLEQDPFTLLWITNCVLFSAVIAFLLCKGWRRGKNNFPREQERLRNGNERKVRDPAREIRKNLSTVQAELDKIRTNGKLTKKGIKNRKSCYENEAHISNTRFQFSALLTFSNFRNKRHIVLVSWTEHLFSLSGAWSSCAIANILIFIIFQKQKMSFLPPKTRL